MRAIREGMRWFLRSGLRWVILALLIVAFLWFVPQLQGENLPQKVPAEERAALVNEYRRTWAQIIGGFGLLLGLYFTWRRIEISQQELEATRDQQVTERFTRAIDQLGATDNEGKNKKLEIRLGGIYALERIAGDSLAMENSPGRDYSTVMEVLTAYVRQNTTQAPGPSNASSEAASTSNEAPAEADEGAKQPAPLEPRRPTADIQAILDVLRRLQARVPMELQTSLDLREANLRGADLYEAQLLQPNLQGANLEGANLQHANLKYANLQGANLQGAVLEGANLQGVRLQGANLQGVRLQGANLQHAKLLQANLQGANLQGVRLQHPALTGANLQGANFQGGVQQAQLQGASLVGANLQGANLQGAILIRANLQRANLQRANLLQANLQEAQVTDEQLVTAVTLQGATMPDGQKYKVWLKDKEGSGKDVENE
jgi:uncharacterized protein YjbI with pentapeptide repeats